MRGFTVVEILVALVLLSFAGAGLATCLIVAQRAQVESGRWLRAVALAEEGLERARASSCAGTDVAGNYTLTCTAASGGGLERIEVVVRWGEPPPHEFRLATLVRR